jgi:cytochrome c oxidase subunit 3
MEHDRRAAQGAWLFLLSLAVFFLSSMILFVIYIALRLQRLGPEVRDYALPPGFITSTLLLIGVSLSLHMALQAARRDRTDQVLRLCVVASILAMLFFAVQSHGMYLLVTESLQFTTPGLSAYGFTFVLALLHALHVAGGIVALVFVLAKAVRNRYDHERNWGLQFCAAYWHFLDGVWIVMLVGFGIAAYLIRQAS